MPVFLDVHPLKGRTEENLQAAQKGPRDEFGVVHLNFFYNLEEDKMFCLHDAPSKIAIEKHHTKAELICDWIIEVKTTAWVDPVPSFLAKSIESIPKRETEVVAR